MLVKWILLISWAANGTGFTAQEFDSEQACVAALVWAKEAARQRGPALDMICMNKATGAARRA